MTTAIQTVQIVMDGKLVDVEGRIIAPGLAITPSMYHEGWSCISHLPSGKAVISGRCPEHVEDAARFLTGHPTPIDWTQPEEAIVGDQAIKDFIVSVNDAVGRCYDCGPKYDGPTWSVRCTTCDWRWEDEFNEGSLDAKAAKDMARNHECEPEVELSPPGDSNEWFAEWLVKDDGTIGGGAS